MLYFIFMIEERGAVFKPVKMAGRYLIMFAFGASFGGQMMGVFSRIIERIYSILGV
jgi:hypothetical protein